MENEELYRRAQAGEADAFERLHKQLANFIRSIALESCRHFGCTDVVSASLLEDLCAEGDLELWERIHSGGYDEHTGKLTTYLYPFLRGRMYRYLETNLGVMSLSKDEMERVRQAQRLYHVEGKSAEEIAAALHLSDEATARLVGYNTHFLSVLICWAVRKKEIPLSGCSPNVRARPRNRSSIGRAVWSCWSNCFRH